MREAFFNTAHSPAKCHRVSIFLQNMGVYKCLCVFVILISLAETVPKPETTTLSIEMILKKTMQKRRKGTLHVCYSKKGGKVTLYVNSLQNMINIYIVTALICIGVNSLPICLCVLMCSDCYYFQSFWLCHQCPTFISVFRPMSPVSHPLL